jgi:succinoglycan biosynthesis protein ExoV
MELIYYRHPVHNFGDDLNAVLWPRLLPPEVFERQDVALLGIGSIFNSTLRELRETKAKNVVVIGSGAGYGPLPKDWSTWNILAVRGPLTAELIGQPKAAVTDGAALLRLVPEFMQRVEKADQIVFMPHYHSAERGQWERVSAELGFLYVDPRWSVESVLEHLSRAKLVITEAMHGAIVADAMRIPWIPILIEPDALPFKWRDWTLSLDIDYKPTTVTPSSGREAMYHARQRVAAKRSGLANSARLANLTDPKELVADFRRRYVEKSIEVRPTPATSNSNGRGLGSLLTNAAAVSNGYYLRKAVNALKGLEKQEQFLSAEHVLNDRVQRLVDAVDKFTRIALE